MLVVLLLLQQNRFIVPVKSSAYSLVIFQVQI